MTKLGSVWRVVLFTLAVSQLVVSCMTDDASNKPFGAPQQTSAPVNANGGMARGDPGQLAGGDMTGGDYRIAPSDIIQIAVFQVADLNTTVQVSEDGNVTLPLVGKVRLSGETTYEAEQTISRKLRTYLQSPQVSISVKTYGKRITVSGEVRGPRVLADDGSTTLSQAIANAGGLSELGDSSRVHVAKSINQHVQDEVYNLDDIQAGKAPDPVLRGGDIIVVESSGTRVALKNVKDLLPFAIFASLI
jgi:polysaccharide export outer membrane protein